MMLKITIRLTVFSWTTWCLSSGELIDDYDWGTAMPTDGRTISTNNNSLFLGTVLKDDDVVFEEDVEIKGVPGKVLEHTVYFPKKGSKVHKKINFISIIDVDLFEEGGMPTVTSGGINCTHATIHLKSQVGKGLDFVIVIRGRTPI